MSSHQSEHETTVVRLDDGHPSVTVAFPSSSSIPAFPHVERLSDPSDMGYQARRTPSRWPVRDTRSCALLFPVAYFAVGTHDHSFVPGLGRSPRAICPGYRHLGLGLLGIGLGAVHWSQDPMPTLRSSKNATRCTQQRRGRQGFVDVMRGGGESSQLFRRPLIKATSAVRSACSHSPSGAVGRQPRPLPRKQLSQTMEWHAGARRHLRALRHRLPAPDARPREPAIKASDVTIGSVYHVLPEGPAARPETGEGGLEHGVLEEGARRLSRSACVSTLTVPGHRRRPQGRPGPGATGHRRLPKICTHVWLPRRPVRADNASPTLPLPPVDLRCD